jgi:hypothetical protein
MVHIDGFEYTALTAEIFFAAEVENLPLEDCYRIGDFILRKDFLCE